MYTYSLHGGAGALISVGLLRNVPLEPMRKCVTSQYNSGEARLHSLDPVPSNGSAISCCSHSFRLHGRLEREPPQEQCSPFCSSDCPVSCLSDFQPTAQGPGFLLASKNKRACCSAGGDAFLTTCLWKHGFGITDLDPLWHPQGLTMFDPSPPPLNPDDFIVQKAAHVLGNLLRAAAGTCVGLCEV